MQNKETGFLSLGLKKFNTIKIGNDVEITLKRCMNNVAYLDIKAPRDLNISRHDDYYAGYAQRAQEHYHQRKAEEEKRLSMSAVHDLLKNNDDY